MQIDEVTPNRQTGSERIIPMKQAAAKTIKAFAVELVVYAVLVTAYFFLVLHCLGDSLYQLEQGHRWWYAVVAILLIVGQAVLLQNVTSFLLRIIRRRSE